MKRLLFAVLFVGAALALAPHAEAQNISIMGKVTMQDGSPVAGAEVIAVPGTEGRGRRTLKTGKDGSYRFPFLEFGKYRVKVAKPGLVMYTISVSAKLRGQPIVETKGEIGPKQEIPEYTYPPGTAVVYDVVMAPESYYANFVSGEEADKLNQLMTDANKLFVGGDYAASKDLVQQVLDKVNNQSGPWYLYGADLAGLGQREEADKALKKAIELDPKLPGPRAQLGLLALKGGDAATAINWFNEELTLTPDSVPLLINRAIAITETGQKAEAVAAWKHILEMAPQEPAPYTELANLYTDMGQEENAAAVMQQMEQVAKPSAATWFNIGAGYANRDQTENAEKAFRKALDLDPNFAEANREMGYISLRRGQAAAAISYLEKYLAARPDAPDADAMKKLLEQAKASAAQPAPPAKPARPGDQAPPPKR